MNGLGHTQQRLLFHVLGFGFREAGFEGDGANEPGIGLRELLPALGVFPILDAAQKTGARGEAVIAGSGAVLGRHIRLQEGNVTRPVKLSKTFFEKVERSGLFSLFPFRTHRRTETMKINSMKRTILFGLAPNRLAIVLAALSWLAGGVPVRAETITGTFRYSDLNPADGTIVLRPIQFCAVEVSAYRPRPPFGIWTWGKELDTTTDANGSISVPIAFQVPGVTYGVNVSAQNYAAIVWPNQPVSLSPFWQQPGQPDGTSFQRAVIGAGDILNFSYDFTDSWTPQHWSLADAVRHGFDYVAARRDPRETDPLPPAGVQPGFITTFYNPVNQSLEINNIHVWEDFTILHEYGHFVEHQISHFVAIPSV